jgi:ABC-type glycerol-3-phosphate transport system substrate-binding protein
VILIADIGRVDMIVRIFFLLILTLTIVSACFPGSDIPEAPPADQSGITIITFAAPEASRSLYRPIISDFMQENQDIQIKIIPFEDISVSAQ